MGETIESARPLWNIFWQHCSKRIMLEKKFATLSQGSSGFLWSTEVLADRLVSNIQVV